MRSASRCIPNKILLLHSLWYCVVRIKFMLVNIIFSPSFQSEASLIWSAPAWHRIEIRKSLTQKTTFQFYILHFELDFELLEFPCEFRYSFGWNSKEWNKMWTLVAITWQYHFFSVRIACVCVSVVRWKIVREFNFKSTNWCIIYAKLQNGKKTARRWWHCFVKQYMWCIESVVWADVACVMHKMSE